jgi:hypothetical protein
VIQAAFCRRALPALLAALLFIACRPARAAEPYADGGEQTPIPAPRGPAGLGEWIESGALRFRVDAVKSCGVVRADGGSAGSMTVLAFVLRFVAGSSDVFLSPRDVTLEAGGVILQAANPVPNRATRHATRCVPALTAKRLLPRQAARGAVMFAISPEFRAGQMPMILAYRPTRWGGAGRLEVKIPRCLEVCKDGGSTKPPNAR